MNSRTGHCIRRIPNTNNNEKNLVTEVKDKLINNDFAVHFENNNNNSIYSDSF